MTITTRRTCGSSRKSTSSPRRSRGRARRRPRSCTRKISKAPCTCLAKLREPVDAFFDHVTVNAENKDLRLNRLRLLNELRVVMLGVADFGKVAGDGGAA